MTQPIGVRRATRRAMLGICIVVAVVIVSSRMSSTRAEKAPTSSPAPASTSPSSLPAPGPADPPWPTHRESTVTEAGRAVFVYPPIAAAEESSSAPVVMMLHGMCSDPQSTCDYWNSGGRHGSWLVCPEGNGSCDGRPDWKGSGEEKAQFLDQAMGSVRRTYGRHVDADDTILIGFSRGAFVARDVIYARPGRYRAAILLGAALTPDPERFKAAGIRRVVMGAGEYDGARLTMQRAVTRLSSAGLPARFVNLGRIGHQLPHDLERILEDALRWARQGEYPPG